MAKQNFSLPWLIDPIDPETFFGEYWESKPLLIKRGEPDYYKALLSLAEIDRVITSLNLRYPDLEVTSANHDIQVDDYALRDDLIDTAKVYELFADGATIVLPGLHEKVPSLGQLCKSMEREFSQPFQTNIYLTPADAQGFKKHFDSHDVFVMQIAGSKDWKIYGNPVELPLRNQKWDSGQHEPGDLTMEFVLEEGDVVYIPRGVVHEAPSRDEVSLHITFGVLAWTWSDLIIEALSEAAARDVEFRRTLPPGFAREEFDRDDADSRFRDLLKRFVDTAEFDQVLDYYVDQLISFHQPVLSGQMTQIAKLDNITVDSKAGVRPAVLYRYKRENGALEIGAFNKTITLPGHAEPAVRFALENEDFRIGDLPGDLDDAGKLTLIRRLVREGLVEVH